MSFCRMSFDEWFLYMFFGLNIYRCEGILVRVKMLLKLLYCIWNLFFLFLLFVNDKIKIFLMSDFNVFVRVCYIFYWEFNIW